MEELFKQFLAKTLGLTGEQVSELLVKDSEGNPKPELLTALLDKDKTRIKALKTKAHEDEFDKAKAKAHAEIESKIKAKAGIESDKIGDELIDEVFAKKDEAGSKGKPTEADVKTHPYTLALENKLKAKEEEFETKLTKAIADKEAEFSQKETFRSLEAKAVEKWLAKEPVISADPAKRQKAIEVFKSNLKSLGEFIPNESDFIAKKDGNRLEDEHGNPYNLDKFVEMAGDFVDYKVATDRSSAGNKTTTAADSKADKKYKGPAPKTKPELNKLLNDNSIPVEERQELRTQYEGKLPELV